MTDKDPALEKKLNRCVDDLAKTMRYIPHSFTLRDEFISIIRTAFAEALEDTKRMDFYIPRMGLFDVVYDELGQVAYGAHGLTGDHVLYPTLRAAIDSARGAEGRGRDVEA